MDPGRRRNAAADRQPLRWRRRRSRVLSGRASHLGRGIARRTRAMGRGLGHGRSIMPSPIPLATYRIQLTSAFGFDEAAKIVPYLKQLGITHLYASPFLKARSGSTHGYDIVDHNALNPELGGEEAFNRLSAALKANDLGLLLDC